VKRLKYKEREITLQFNKLCDLLNIDEPTLGEKLLKLNINIEKLAAKKTQKIKSKV